jgi:hypothetical protein
LDPCPPELPRLTLYVRPHSSPLRRKAWAGKSGKAR